MIENFSAISGGELAQVLGVFLGMLGGFYAFAYKLLKTIEANTQATIEMKNFLVNLNGSLKKVVAEKQEEAAK